MKSNDLKPKVLFVGEFTGLNTGYSTFYKTLMQAVQAQGIEVEELACCVNQNHPAIDYVPWRVHANIPTDPQELERYRATPGGEFGAYSFEKVLLKSKPSHIFDGRDAWHWCYQTFSPLRDFYSIIASPAIDNESQNIQWLEQYRTCDALLGYTSWGCNIMKNHGVKNVIGVCSPIVSNVFKPVQSKKQHQSTLGLGEIKVLGFVARNQPRKLIPDLFATFSKFLKESGRNDTYLYIHTDFPAVWQLDVELNRHGVGHRTLFTYICTKCGQIEPSFFSGAGKTCGCGGNQIMTNGAVGASQEQLCSVYNLFDIHIQMSTNEGYCLPVAESAACGVLSICMDHSSTAEVGRRVNAVMIKPLGLYTECESGRKLAIPDIDKYSDELIRLTSLPAQMLRRSGLVSNLMFNENYGSKEVKKTIENLITAINTTSPKKHWNDNTNYSHTTANNFKGLSDGDFVKWIIVDVLGKPNYMGTQLEARLLRDLSNGYSNGGFSGQYYWELTAARGNNNVQPFTREICYNHFVNLCNINNVWERERVNSIC